MVSFSIAMSRRKRAVLGVSFRECNEDKRLVLPCLIQDLLIITHFVCGLEALDRLLLSDIDELLLKTARSVRSIKIEAPFRLVNVQEGRDIPRIAKTKSLSNH